VIPHDDDGFAVLVIALPEVLRKGIEGRALVVGGMDLDPVQRRGTCAFGGPLLAGARLDVFDLAMVVLAAGMENQSAAAGW